MPLIGICSRSIYYLSYRLPVEPVRLCKIGQKSRRATFPLMFGDAWLTLRNWGATPPGARSAYQVEPAVAAAPPDFLTSCLSHGEDKAATDGHQLEANQVKLYLQFTAESDARMGNFRTSEYRYKCWIPKGTFEGPKGAKCIR